jgi:hypothetical protein
MASNVVSRYHLPGDTGAAATIGGTEVILGQYYNCAVPWGALPGTQFRPGLSGRITVGTNPVILRVRIGGGYTPGGNPVGGGTIAYEVTLPVGPAVDLAGVGDVMAKPSGNSAFALWQVTAQAVSGTTGITTEGLVATVEPTDGVGQGLYLTSWVFWIPPGDATERLVEEWIVDFDQFEGVTNLLVAMAMGCDGGAGGGIRRVRIGGTAGVAFGNPVTDGALVCTWVNDGGLQPFVGARKYGGAQNVVPFAFSGVQPVKFTYEGGVEGSRPGVILREAL